MTAHDYSQNEFLGKNPEIYESDIQDHRDEIRRLLAGRHAYNISNIQRRIQYLEERITDMDERYYYSDIAEMEERFEAFSRQMETFIDDLSA